MFGDIMVQVPGVPAPSTPWWLVVVPAATGVVAGLLAALLTAKAGRTSDLRKWQREAILETTSQFLTALGELEEMLIAARNWEKSTRQSADTWNPQLVRLAIADRTLTLIEQEIGDAAVELRMSARALILDVRNSDPTQDNWLAWLTKQRQSVAQQRDAFVARVQARLRAV
jgi:hypothetical protein